MIWFEIEITFTILIIQTQSIPEFMKKITMTTSILWNSYWGGLSCSMWNHIFLWGSMFIGSQNFHGSWGRNFIGSVIRIILININKWFCTGWCGCKFVGKVYPRKPWTLVDPPTNNDDSLVFSQNTCTCMHNTSTYNKF